MAILTLDDKVKEDLIASVVTPELYKHPIEILIDIKGVLHYLKNRKPSEESYFIGYRRLQKIEKIRQSDLSWLSGKMVILDKRHFNKRGKQLIANLELQSKEEKQYETRRDTKDCG